MAKSIQISDEIHKKLKLFSARGEIKMQETVEKLLEFALKNLKPTEK